MRGKGGQEGTEGAQMSAEITDTGSIRGVVVGEN